MSTFLTPEVSKEDQEKNTQFLLFSLGKIGLSCNRVQKICPEEEFPRMMEVLKSDLPSSFRITGSRYPMVLGTYLSYTVEVGNTGIGV
jgi:hypothetical protein